jgi:hypothetical protein
MAENSAVLTPRAQRHGVKNIRMARAIRDGALAAGFLDCVEVMPGKADSVRDEAKHDYDTLLEHLQPE